MPTFTNKRSILDAVNNDWANRVNPSYQATLFPFKPPKGAYAGWASGYPRLTNPPWGTGWGGGGWSQYPNYAWNVMANGDWRRCRVWMNTANTPSTDQAYVASAMGVYSVNNDWGNASAAHSVVAYTPIDTTTIGNPFLHPPYAGTANTTAGAAYLTGVNLGILGALQTHGHTVVRIESGSDAGIYIVQSWDNPNGRLYLRNLDGTMFNGQATATGVSITMGGREVFFNETGVIPNGTGSATFSGTFDPGDFRGSFIMRINYEKTGTVAGDFTSGSYWFTLRRFITGDGGNDNYVGDQGLESDQSHTYFLRNNSNLLVDNGTTSGFIHVPGVAIDNVNQRVWMIASDGNTGGSIHWRWYKSPFAFQCVVNTNGGNVDAISGLSMSGGTPVALALGSDGAAYVAVKTGANAGVIKINSDGVSGTQALATTWGTGANINNLIADTTRARTGTAGDVSTTAAGNTITSASGAFTAADVGRAIKIAGATADNGTYLISSVTDATHVVVTTTAGAAVSFTGGTGGTFSIGDRLYVMFSDLTTLSGGLKYLEPLAGLDTLFSTGVALTADQSYNFAVGSQGMMPPAIAIDTAGVLYWASAGNGTGWRLNRYDPATRAVQTRLLTDFNGLNGGTGSISNPGVISALGCNPHASFHELWIGTDQGHIKLTDPANFTTSAFVRYSGDANYFVNGAPHDAGHYWVATTGEHYNYCFTIDGRVYATFLSNSGYYGEFVQYKRDGDTWITASPNLASNGYPERGGYRALSACSDKYGGGVWVQMCKQDAPDHVSYREWTSPIHYQWISNAWTPKEVVRGTLPDSFSSPGCSCKPLHTTTDDLVMGVKVAFTPQGGATPANNEFLGRMGQTSAQRTDGATTAASATFVGSGFTTSDTGRYLRIESGSDQGVYRVTYVDANHITLKTLRGAAFNPTTTASTLSYTLWEKQVNAGPETVSLLLADGIGKDNTTTVSNINYDLFLSRTSISDQAEPIKFAVNADNFGAADSGSIGVKGYRETYYHDYSAGLPQHIALSGTPTALVEQLIRGTDNYMNGGGARPNLNFFTDWYGITGNTTKGIAHVIDLGANVEVGSIVMGYASYTGADSALDVLAVRDNWGGWGGTLINLHGVAGSTPPATSSVQRTSGTGNLNITTGNSTISLTSGDFLGTSQKTGTAGTTTARTSTFGEAVGTFTSSHVGMALKITSGADIGAYRIIAVATDGSSCTIQNLDMSTYTFAGTASGISWSIWDAVRPEDLITVGTHKLGVERLLSSTSAQVRVMPSATLTAQNWTAIEPSWDLIKRVAVGEGYAPPDVVNNGTFVTAAGEFFDNGRAEVVIDLGDLTTTQRTRRYWKLSLIPRTEGTINLNSNNEYINYILFFDTAGKLIGACDYNRLDAARDDADYQGCLVSQIDWIQASDAGVGAQGDTGFNGLASVAADGVTVTLAGGNAFMGFHVRDGSTAAMTAGGNTIATTAGTDADWKDSDIGRYVRITGGGADDGIYRISGVTDAQHITVTQTDGTAVAWAASLVTQAWHVYEGFGAGDYMAFPDPSNAYDTPVSKISLVSADLKTITLARPVGQLTSKKWEIRRIGYADSSTTTNAAVSARVLFGDKTAPVQPGDITHQYIGQLEFYPHDVATRITYTDGVTAAGSGAFTATAAKPSADDVGRLLVISSGADVGVYKISAVSGNLALASLATGAAVSLTTSASGVSYTIIGDRRFRAARYVAILEG